MNRHNSPEESRPVVLKRGGLTSKLFESLNKFIKRLHNNNNFLSDFKSNKRQLSNSASDLNKSMSHENLNFMRYIENVPKKNNDSSDYEIETSRGKWEALSQIHHTPRKDGDHSNSYSYTENSKTIPRHRSMSDLTSVFNNFNNTKHTEKLNSVLDFVVSQFFNKSNNDALTKSIEELIVEACVQVILQSAHITQESIARRTHVKYTNYLKAVCSTENSSSDSDQKQSYRKYERDIKTPNNSIMSMTKENEIPDLRSFKEHTMSCISDSQIDRKPKSKLNMRNIMSPNFYESSAFKYKSKSYKTSTKLSKKVTKREERNDNFEKKFHNEYCHYVSAKKASCIPQGIVKHNVTSPIDTAKNFSGMNNSQNLSPIPEAVDTLNNIQSIKKPVLAKTYNPVSIPNSKTKVSLHSTYVFKKSAKKNQMKENEAVPEVIHKLPIKTTPKHIQNGDLNTKLQMTKATIVNCIGQDNVLMSNVCSNIKVLNIKFNGNSLPKALKEPLKFSPITFVFAGDFKNKIKHEKDQKLLDLSLSEFKNVVSNLVYSNDDLSLKKPTIQILEHCPVKSTTTFVRDSGYNNEGIKKTRISNYYVVKPDIGECNNDFKNSNNNSQVTCDWSKLFSEPLNLLTSIKANCDVSKSSDLINIPPLVMVNNNKGDIDSSETQNTDSSCTFHAVKAKYFKQYCSINYDSENDNLTSATNGLSQYISNDPNSRQNFESIKSENDVDKFSVGNTYSCIGSNVLYNMPPLVNSQSFITKYQTSSDTDDTDLDNQKYESTRCLDDTTKILSDFSSQERNSVAEELKLNTNSRVVDKSQWNIISTSNIDVSPTDTNNELEEGMFHELDQDFNIVYCRSSGDKKLRKNQKSISDNLLKHTFASQQKIRLKHE